MGGKPVTAMNIVCFPSCDLEEDILAQTLKGGIDKINESGATLLGGHSVDDPEFKYGLSVTGIVHPEKVLTNTGAQSGDVIVLTKPVGTGIFSTAVKAKLASTEDIKEAVSVMSMLNKTAADVMKGFEVHACTDVTGFGLAGHLLEVAKGSNKELILNSASVPMLKNAMDFASMGFVPAGAHKNRTFFEKDVKIKRNVDRALADVLFDPQTSGGLLIFLNESQAEALIKQMKTSGVEVWQIGAVSRENQGGFLTII